MRQVVMNLAQAIPLKLQINDERCLLIDYIPLYPQYTQLTTLAYHHHFAAPVFFNASFTGSNISDREAVSAGLFVEDPAADRHGN